MNRQIKFRVYNNKTKQWTHGPNSRPDLDGCNLFGECILLGGFMDKVSIKDLNDCEALQFTGLKDKNGKEIFEGDVVNFYTPAITHGPDREFYENQLVKFNLKYVGFYFGNYDFCISEIVDIEVVGNIFDNPNLMETEYKCPHCGSDKGTWFDRCLFTNSKGEETMANRCEGCGEDVDDKE